MRGTFLIVVCLLAGCSDSSTSLITGNTMGTTYSVKIVTQDENPPDEEALKEEIDRRLLRINNLMSTYLSDSELSRFNQSPVGERFEISAETEEVLRMAREIHKMSGGKFDVTVGPLVNLWGFGPEPGNRKVPSEADIESTKARVGMDKLLLDDGGLTKEVNIYLDLSAIAKGFGVDELTRLLDERGYENYLVEIGGELRAHGKNERHLPWRIAVEKPDSLQRTPFQAIEVTNMAMATSGDYRNYFEVDGKRYSHTINPLTGFPIDHNVASVTVLSTQTAMADGLATAIIVMGADAGLSMAEEYNLAVLLILKHPDGFVERYTSAFEPYMSQLN